MARVPFDPLYSEQGGPQADASHFGGYANRTEKDPVTGQQTIVGTNREDYVDRYRGLGAAAAAREAYQLDFRRAQADEMRSAKTREGQKEAAKLLRDAAQGNAPSAAAILGGQVGGQSLAQAMQAQAGAKGGLASAVAAKQAMQAQGAAQLGGMGQFAGMRASEMGEARDQYLGGVTGIRGQDYQQQGLAQQRAEAQAQSEMAQRTLNQQAQMAYEQRGFDVNAAELERNLRQRQISAGYYGVNAAKQQANKDAYMNIIGSGIGAGATMGAGAISSDERAKDSVMPLYEPEGQYLQMDSSGRGYLASEQPTSRGASLSGPTPRYSMAQASAAKEKVSPKVPAPQRKLTDAEMKELADRMLAGIEQQKGAQLASGASVRDRDPMSAALASGLKPYSYEYKPEHRPPEQAPHEKNVGPMAQEMATNPVTGSAVKTGEDGMMYIDLPKATKLTLGATGHLAQKQQETDDRLAALEDGGGTMSDERAKANVSPMGGPSMASQRPMARPQPMQYAAPQQSAAPTGGAPAPAGNPDYQRAGNSDRQAAPAGPSMATAAPPQPRGPSMGSMSGYRRPQPMQSAYVPPPQQAQYQTSEQPGYSTNTPQYQTSQAPDPQYQRVEQPQYATSQAPAQAPPWAPPYGAPTSMPGGTPSMAQASSIRARMLSDVRGKVMLSDVRGKMLRGGY